MADLRVRHFFVSIGVMVRIGHALTRPLQNLNIVFNTTFKFAMKSVTAADANRHFSTILRTVAAGEEVTVVSRGKPVARISPVKQDEAGRKAARQELLKRLGKQRPTGQRDWTRDELYED